MSTDITASEPATNGHVNSSSTAEALNAPVTSRPASISKIRPGRMVAAVTVLITLVIAGVVGTNLFARQYTPDGAVRQYLAALQTGDASTAWNQIQVSASNQTTKASLIDQQALRAALAAAKPDIKGFDITDTQNSDASTALVSFTYSTSAGSKQAKFVVQRSGQTRFAVFPVWLIILQPTLLQLALPGGAGRVDVDGRSLALPAGKSTIAVLPVAHKITFQGSGLLAPATVSLDAFGSLAQTVNYTPEFTTDGLPKVKAAVKAAFDICARQTSANAADFSSCPQGLSYSSSNTGQWSLIGDPTSDLAVSFDKDMNAVAQGHFQMVFAYNEDGFAAPRREPAAGGYSADLKLTSTDVMAVNLKPASGLPQLNRPSAATDQAVDSIVSAAFAKCAALRLQYVANCPQQIGAAGATDVRWTLASDPLSGAVVTFDATSGLITVHGNFQMSATYTWLGNSDSAQSFVTSYDAYLFWDGSALQLVTVDGSSS
jgi:hypothetical protein